MRDWYAKGLSKKYAIVYVPRHGDLKVGTAFSMFTATPRASLFHGAYVTAGAEWRDGVAATMHQ
jgi:hypothetical protein